MRWIFRSALARHELLSRQLQPTWPGADAQIIQWQRGTVSDLDEAGGKNEEEVDDKNDLHAMVRDYVKGW